MIRTSDIGFYQVLGQYEPIPWPEGGKHHSIRHQHRLDGTYHLHNPADPINDGKSPLERTLVSYRVLETENPLYAVSDLFSQNHLFTDDDGTNLTGDIGERIARRKLKYFLHHTGQANKKVGLFDKRFSVSERDSFIVANNDDYILKILHYPNMVILRKGGDDKFGYQNIKELDGLFNYQLGRQQHLIVMESKTGHASVRTENLVRNLFTPLKKLFPEAHLSYTLFCPEEQLIQTRFRTINRLRKAHVKLYHDLLREGVATLFFSFSEKREDFRRIRKHLKLHKDQLDHKQVMFTGRTIISEEEVTVYNGGENPIIRFVQDPDTGLYRRVPG